MIIVPSANPQDRCFCHQVLARWIAGCLEIPCKTMPWHLKGRALTHSARMAPGLVLDKAPLLPADGRASNACGPCVMYSTSHRHFAMVFSGR